MENKRCSETEDGIYGRTRLLLGKGVDILKKSHVAVFGIGGVGSYTVEALARAGVGTLTVIDADTVCESNINRQLIALHSTMEMPKVFVAEHRLTDINPDIKVCPRQVFFSEETLDDFDFSSFDYTIDAIDTVSSKILLAEACRDAGTPLISCMGAGNKLDPTAFRVADIYDTSVCPLARRIRTELRKRGITSMKAVFSTEKPINPQCGGENGRAPGSVSFVPSVAGLIIAGEVIKDLTGIR